MTWLNRTGLLGVGIFQLTFGAVPANALDQASLNVIADFADRICDKIETSGKSSDLLLEGEANAEFNALLSKLVDMGASGAVKYQSSEYVGVLRKDLADVLKDSRNCKLEVVKQLQEDLSKPTPPVAQDDLVQTQEDVEIIFDVLANDLNITDLGNAVVNRQSDPTHGRLDYLGEGRFRYAPEPDFSGDDQFSYEVVSDTGEASQAVVRIIVEPSSDPPELDVSELKLSYPFDAVYLFDIVGSVTDRDGDEVQLKSFQVPGVIKQPLRATEAALELESVYGPLSTDQNERAQGMLVLTVDQWLGVNDPETLRTSRRLTLDYVLEDSRGASTPGSLSIDAHVARLAGVRFSCSEVSGPLPKRITYDLKFDDKEVSGTTVNSSRADDWRLGLAHAEYRFTDFEKVTLVAQWRKGETGFELKCSPTLVAEGKEVPLKEISIKGISGQEEKLIYLGFDGHPAYTALEGVIDDIFGR